MKIKEMKLKEATKKLSIKEGIASAIMDGAGVKYITPYALALGANNTQIGFLTSIPSLLGNLSQLFTHNAVEKFSRKKIIAVGVLLQALMWIPIIILGYLFFYKNFNHGLSATLVILFYTLFTIFGSFISPAWNSVMRDDVGKNRGKYFGKRGKIVDFTGLIVMLVCGFILNYFNGINLFAGFAVLFGIACISRLISSYLLSKHYEPKLKLKDGYYFSFWQFIRRVPQSNFGKFTVGVSLITFASYIASPFFSVYLLKNLEINYALWTLILVGNILGTLAFVQLWGKFADNYGNLKVLKITGKLIPLIPLLWFLTFFVIKINFVLAIFYLIIVEIFSGFLWGGFNLCSKNFIYDAVTRAKTGLCISYYNVLNGIGVFLGATLGGFISSVNFDFFGVGAILFVFLLSSLMRIISYFVLMPKVKEVRGVKEYRQGKFERELRNVIIPSPFKYARFSYV